MDNDVEQLIGQQQQPLSVIFDTYAEELSFPNIYFGEPRVIKSGVKSTPFSLATSELRRKDRRGVTPQHILYMAAKIIRLRVVSGLNHTFKLTANTANITRRMIENRDFMEHCVDNNLAFLQSVPNSVHYWASRKKDLFALIRQLGKPTIFLTLSANEIRWPILLKLLHKLQKEGNSVELNDPLCQLRALERATLVNEDPVICCIYFNKLVNVIMQIISSKSSYNPFGKYRVIDYFQRIEFQHRGSPHAHILLWLENAPNEPTSENMPNTVQLITDICSVSFNDLPLSYANQIHKHTFTCFKKNNKNCRFHIPYWPMDRTRILLPLNKADGRYNTLKTKAPLLYTNLSERIYSNIGDFLQKNNITMSYYLDIIRASLNRPTVIFERKLSEIWTNTFHPWIGSILNSNMDIQYVLDEYSCASYVVEYVNKSNRGVSNLHTQLIELHAEHPSADFTELMKKICINMINTVEMSSQEAAWYLLRQPMSKCNRKVIFIPTMWPDDRHKTYKKRQQMDEENLPEDSTDVWTLNILQKYEKRESQLELVCLADFAANYTWSNKKKRHVLRKQSRILRYANYKMVDNISEYKREMVTLFHPFRNEHIDILDHLKYINIFNQNSRSIMELFSKYAKMDIDKYMEEYRQLMKESENERDAVFERQDRILVQQATIDANNDDINEINNNTHLTSIVRQRSNVLSATEFCEKMRATNTKQRDFLLTLLKALVSNETIQVFFTGAAGTGKTFTLNLAKEIVNRFSQTHTTRTNAYVACASTGKAAVAIEGTTVHSAFRIAISRRQNISLRKESIQIYRNSFAGVKTIFIDEVSMIGANTLEKIESRMREITGNFNDYFGGFNVIFCGDLRQLPPVNAKAIYKAPAKSICGPHIWQSLKFYCLTQVMRQSDIIFSSILTKIGNGTALSIDEITLLESRFRTQQWCNDNVPHAIRLFHQNSEVEKYNAEVITSNSTCISSTCVDVFVGYKNNEELVAAKTKVYKMSVAECGGLPYILNICIGKPYILNTNIDVEDGLVNGAIGIIKYIEYDEEDETMLKRIWVYFDSAIIGAKLRIKARPLVASKPNILLSDWTPISKRHATLSPTNTIKCKRTQFPISPACALTIHKSQGGTFTNVVFNYTKSQQQQLVYVALTRVTCIEGLFITNNQNDFKFYHGKENNSPNIIELRNEMQRLHNYSLLTVCDISKQFLSNSAFSLISFNIQSLKAHTLDLECDEIIQLTDIILLNETWLDNAEDVNINNFRFINKYKRENVRAGGVCIYEHFNKEISTPHTLLRFNNNPQSVFNAHNSIGDICAAEIYINNKKHIIISVYVNPNNSVKNVELFISAQLLAYSKNVHLLSAELADAGYAEIPIIIGGDFNIDLTKEDNRSFIHFMKERFDLDIISDISPTTKSTSCIDIIFSRYIPNIKCHTHISYYSYHSPILLSIKNID